MRHSKSRHGRAGSGKRNNSLSNRSAKPSSSRAKSKRGGGPASVSSKPHKRKYKKTSKFGLSASSPERRGNYKKRTQSRHAHHTDDKFGFFEDKQPSSDKQNESRSRSLRSRKKRGNRSYDERDSRSRKNSNHNRNRKGSGSGKRGGKKLPTFNPSQFINTNPIDLVESVYTPVNSFKSFDLNKELLSSIRSLGITEPTEIQDQIIPFILKGQDVIGIAETGTGKTAAFLVPIIEKTSHDNARQTLVLAPTRELALQINEEFRKLSRGMRLFSTTCVGGMNIGPQIKSLRRTNHFIIGTPGRVLDLIKNKHLDPRAITTVVLDEADRMLDMGFIHDMRSILSVVPEKRETLFFSATMSDAVKKLTHDFSKNPHIVSVKKKDVTDSIEQDIVEYHHHDKYQTLFDMLSDKNFERVIVFGSMKHSVERLARQLSGDGISSESIHGNKSHGQRQRALQKFKEGRVPVLVATDVAARGIHVDNVTHVINYDLPNTFEDYVHRIGRTGRGSKKGKALTFIQL